MLNRKPIGPEVAVRVSFNGNQVYRFTATDDDRELVGLDGAEITARVVREVLKDVDSPRLAVVSRTA